MCGICDGCKLLTCWLLFLAMVCRFDAAWCLPSLRTCFGLGLRLLCFGGAQVGGDAGGSADAVQIKRGLPRDGQAESVSLSRTVAANLVRSRSAPLVWPVCLLASPADIVRTRSSQGPGTVRTRSI
jgi:hypothetical protein